MSNLATQSGPQDVSQLQATVNALTVAINGLLSGTTPIVSALVNGTTSAILPAYGKIILASTVAAAAYKLAAPVPGQTVKLISKSTKSQTVTLVSGNFVDTRTKLTFKTTNVGIPQSIELIGLSTAVWGVSGAAGAVKCT